MEPAWLQKLDGELRERVQPAGMPAGSDLMKATVTHEPFTRSDWVYERKLDGERILAIKDGDRICLLAHNERTPSDGRG